VHPSLYVIQRVLCLNCYVASVAITSSMAVQHVVMAAQQVNGDSDIRLLTESKVLDRSSPNFEGIIT